MAGEEFGVGVEAGFGVADGDGGFAEAGGDEFELGFGFFEGGDIADGEDAAKSRLHHVIDADGGLFDFDGPFLDRAQRTDEAELDEDGVDINFAPLDVGFVVIVDEVDAGDVAVVRDKRGFRFARR